MLAWDRHRSGRSEELIGEICFDGNLFYPVDLGGYFLSDAV